MHSRGTEIIKNKIPARAESKSFPCCMAEKAASFAELSLVAQNKITAHGLIIVGHIIRRISQNTLPKMNEKNTTTLHNEMTALVKLILGDDVEDGLNKDKGSFDNFQIDPTRGIRDSFVLSQSDLGLSRKGATAKWTIFKAPLRPY